MQLTGVVIGHTDLGEADRIVRFLTAEQGRVAVLAQGARRSKKRFAGMLEVGNRVKVMAYQPKGGLPRIQEVELVDGVNRPRSDLIRLTLVAYGCEVAGRLAGEHTPEERLTRLLVVWIELLEQEAPVGIAARQALEAKALRFAGILPDLLRCSRCGRVLDSEARFPADGGPVHATCGAGTVVTPEGLRALDLLLRTPLFSVRDEQASSAGWVLSERIEHHSRAPLKSAVLLRELLQP